MDKPAYDVITIGGGPAGYAAAIYATRYKLDALLIAEEFGGLMLYSDLVENYPGFASIHGPDLMEKMKEHAANLDVSMVEARVDAIKRDGQDFVIQTANGTFKARAIIIATGTARRKLGVPGEEENVGMGVSYCATCDAPFFKNRVCCVVGGSDSAAKEALVLSRVAKKVHVIYRKGKLRAEPLMSERVYNTENIEVIHNASVTSICTNEHGIVDKVVLDDGTSVNTNGVFIEIGFDPRSDIAKDLGVDVNEKDEIRVDREGRTNIAGLFAAGDVTDSALKQAITAAGDGARCAWAAYQYVELERGRS